MIPLNEKILKELRQSIKPVSELLNSRVGLAAMMAVLCLCVINPTLNEMKLVLNNIYIQQRDVPRMLAELKDLILLAYHRGATPDGKHN